MINEFLPLLLLAQLGLPAAPGNSEPRALSITAAIDEALLGNLDLRAASAHNELMRLGVDRSRAAYYPSLYASASSSADVLGGSASTTTTTTDPIGGSLKATVSGRLNLFNGFGDGAAVDESELLLKADREDLARARQLVVFDTVVQFTSTLAAADLVRVSKDNIEAQRQQLELVEAFHLAGRRPIVDVYQQHADVENAELTLLNAERDLETGKLLLRQILGLDLDVRIEILPFDVDDLINDATPSGSTADSPLTVRSDLRAQGHRVQATQKSTNAALAGYWPSLDLLVEAGTGYSSGGGELGQQLFEDRLGVTAGLFLTIPIFDQGLTANAVEQSRIETTQEELAYDALALRAGIELSTAQQEWRTSVKRLVVTENQLKSAEQSEAAMRERYRLGVSTLAELSLVHARRVDAAYANVKAKYDFVLRAAAVRFYAGDVNGMRSFFER